jgi:hypothetical protein
VGCRDDRRRTDGNEPKECVRAHYELTIVRDCSGLDERERGGQHNESENGYGLDPYGVACVTFRYNTITR